MAGETILETRQLRKEFGGLVAVAGVNIQVKEHTLHSIIGPNGAGKTTLFNLMSGNLRPSGGKVFFRGRDITHLPASRIVHLGIGRSFQITNLFPNLTVLENVRLAVQALGEDNLKFWRHYRHFLDYEHRALEIVSQVGLEEETHLPARVLPHGSQRKLELALTLAPDPVLLLLDEPTAGMAREEIPLLMEVIENIKESGEKTILLVEHKMDLVMDVSDWITVMHRGEVLAEGTPRQIAEDETVQSAYLGGLYGDLTSP